MPAINKPNRFFRNRHDLTFDDVTASWFGTEPSLSNGSAYADLDRDGDLDLVVNNINQPAYILQNTTSNTHYIQLKLQGPAQNPFGLGADVTVYSRGLTQTYPSGRYAGLPVVGRLRDSRRAGVGQSG